VKVIYRGRFKMSRNILYELYTQRKGHDGGNYKGNICIKFYTGCPILNPAQYLEN